MRLVLITSILISQLFCSYAERPEVRWTPERYPNPQLNVRPCGRETGGWVCDPSGLLGGLDALRELDSAIDHLRNATSCECPHGPDCSPHVHGYSIGIAVVKRMDVPANSPDSAVNEHARHFANHLRTKWSFGQCDDDMVIFLALGHPKIWFSLGPRMTQKLTRRRFHDIYESFKSNFTNNQHVADGLLHMIEALTAALTTDTIKNETRIGRSFMPVWLEVIIMFIVFGVLGLIVFMMFKYGQCHLKKKKRGKKKRNRKGAFDACNCLAKKENLIKENGEKKSIAIVGDAEPISASESEADDDEESESSTDQEMDIREHWDMTMSLKRKLSQDRRKMSHMLSYV